MATVSGVVEDLKFKISEGADPNHCWYIEPRNREKSHRAEICPFFSNYLTFSKTSVYKKNIRIRYLGLG